jgi:two-component system, chemotaxis family, protein-glutamate methylesterase/glutaminase
VSTVPVIAIGASLGGLAALQIVLSGLPAELPTCVIVAQHRRADPESQLSWLLSRACALPVIEPEDKLPLQPGHVYLAPSDYHLLVERGWLALSVDPPVQYARPSIDVLFESLADAYGPLAVGVMLTSASADGAEGAAAIKRAGGRVLVQDPRSAESPVGPLAVIARTPVDAVLPLEQLPGALLALCTTASGT